MPANDGGTAANETSETTPASFADLGLAPELLNAINRIGYEVPSPVQTEAIPVLLAGDNLLATAQTGTGKTAAFALPLLSRIEPKMQALQVLVVCPTRELAIQVAEAFSQYAAAFGDFFILPIYGGQDYRHQLRGLKRHPQVVVGTPGRLLDHVRRGSLKLGDLRTLVLDEADEMLRMGFIDDVEALLAQTPASCQRALFSATMPEPIRRVSERFLPNARQVRIASKTVTVERIEQFSLLVYPERKLDALTRILEAEDFDAAILFVRTKAETVTLASKLSARGHSAAAINGDLNQRQREQAVEALKRGRTDILVATDVAARGLDVPRVTHVLNFDLPYDAEAYIHRIGRTGRAGREGRAISLVAPRERNWLRTIERTTRCAMKPYELPSADALQQKRLSQFEAQLLSFAETESLADIQALLDTIAERQDIDIGLLAAALARWLDSNQPGVLPLRAPPELPRVHLDDARRPKGGPGKKKGPRKPVVRKKGKPAREAGRKPGGKGPRKPSR